MNGAHSRPPRPSHLLRLVEFPAERAVHLPRPFDGFQLFAAAIAAVSIVAPSSHAQQAITLHGAVQFNDEHAFNKARWD